METLPFEIAETAHALRKAFDRRAVGLGGCGACSSSHLRKRILQEYAKPQLQAKEVAKLPAGDGIRGGGKGPPQPRHLSGDAVCSKVASPHTG